MWWRVSVFGYHMFVVYFLVKGHAGYVLPRFENKLYLEILQGGHFGYSDLGVDNHFANSISEYKRYGAFDKEQLIRHFTVQAFGICELLTLSLKDLLKMKFEFPKIFEDLFRDVHKRLTRELSVKVENIRLGEALRLENTEVKHNSVQTKVTMNLLSGMSRLL
jgi:CRP-like cAMP-binding protein